MSNQRPTVYCGDCGGLVPIEKGRVAQPSAGFKPPKFACTVSVKSACGHDRRAIVMTWWALRELWQWTNTTQKNWTWVDEQIAIAKLDGHTAPAWRRALAQQAPAR